MQLEYFLHMKQDCLTDEYVTFLFLQRPVQYFLKILHNCDYRKLQVYSCHATMMYSMLNNRSKIKRVYINSVSALYIAVYQFLKESGYLLSNFSIFKDTLFSFLGQCLLYDQFYLSSRLPIHKMYTTKMLNYITLGFIEYKNKDRVFERPIICKILTTIKFCVILK